MVETITLLKGVSMIKYSDFFKTLHDDPWGAEVSSISLGSRSIINDESGKVTQYLQTINMLWQLGIKTIK